MRTVDTYILKEFARNLVLIILSLIVLYLVVDFFQRIRMFISNGATLPQMAAYFIYSLPMILVQMTPVSVLLSSLITFGILSRNCELVALRAAGVSLYRVAAPLVLVAAGIAAFSFMVNELVTPWSNQRVKYTKYIEIQNRAHAGSFKQYQIWYRGKEGIYNFAVFDPHEGVLRGIKINYLDRSMNMTRRIDAAEGRWRDGAWVFEDLIITTFPEGAFPLVEKLASAPVNLPEKPQDFLAVQREPDEMGFGELRRFIEKIRSEGYDATPYRVDLYGKVAFPIVSILMAVLGLCFAARFERSGGVVQGIGIGIAAGLSYWLFFAFAVSLGRSGVLPPMLSAWAANLVFLAGTVLLLRRVKT
ncbi:MAG: LPS export ABC transporter permease LptG [Syntrophales bacterium]|jgi:lipopolysaccharide export system permease protein|nr:LPS export ABC transporter permease LptG [Syntrophales bacterium]MCK9528682.1 LPS export ABC transporter permease LptG [Syntrophales bacterium]MDX9922012.1 LPS export ABC transporter permease LptG [Syntrophales bacterium]